MSLQRGFDEKGGVGVKSAVLREQCGCNMYNSFSVLSGGLTIFNDFLYLVQNTL